MKQFTVIIIIVILAKLVKLITELMIIITTIEIDNFIRCNIYIYIYIYIGVVVVVIDVDISHMNQLVNVAHPFSI